jgi:thiol:disulfide interchange protein
MLMGAMRLTLLAALACLTSLAVPAASSAQWPAPVPEPAPPAGQKVATRLVAEVTAIRPGEPFWVALHQKIAPGWHTYWRNPGDSGEPVALAWSLPPGFVADDIAWPVPQRIPVGPVVSFGFENEVLLPVRITPPAALEGGQRLDLRAHASWLVCEKECIPEERVVSLSLPISGTAPAPDPKWGAPIAAARDALPRLSPWPASFSVKGDTVTLALTTAGLARDRITAAEFFPYEWGAIHYAGAQALDVSRTGLSLSMARGQLREAVSRPVEGVLVITERLDSGPSRQALIVRAEPSSTRSEIAWTEVTRAAGLALLGGLVLNLMPCVLPVLSVKVMSLVAHAGGAQSVRWRHGLAYTAGVLLAFGLVGGALVALRAGGEGVGWGFHLQSPTFVALLAYVLFAVGLSLSGVIVIGSRLAALSGSRLAGVGSNVVDGPGHRGSFLAGMLATVVATPCTAPFMATALGYALTQPAVVALVVFEALGLGLALPYLVLSLAPGWARLVPRPGAWMRRLEQVLAIPLYASVAWLLWVLSQQTSAVGLAACIAGLVLIAIAAWLHRASRHAAGGRRLAARTVTAAGVVAAVALTLVVARSAPRVHAQARGEAESYSPARLAELRARGVPVFVNVTAVWCITCLVNERVVLKAPAVTEGFARQGVVTLKADWTNREPEITRMLASFDRSGVPLYLLYPRSQRGALATGPRVLPQILTERALLESLERL